MKLIGQLTQSGTEMLCGIKFDIKLIMTTSSDFDYFLKHGFIENLLPGTSMSSLLTMFGDDKWYIKEKESNGLVYGIMKK